MAGILKNKIWKYYISFILIAGKTIEKTGCCIRCQKIIGNRSYRLLLLSHNVDILNSCDKIKESRACTISLFVYLVFEYNTIPKLLTILIQDGMLESLVGSTCQNRRLSDNGCVKLDSK